MRMIGALSLVAMGMLGMAASKGEADPLTVGSRALVTIGGDVLVLAKGSLLGRPVTKVAQSAVDAVKEWRFEPARKDGKAIAVRVSLQIQFHSM